MFMEKGWRARHAAAMARNANRASNSGASAELTALLHERELKLAAAREAERAGKAPVGMTTAATMLGADKAQETEAQEAAQEAQEAAPEALASETPAEPAAPAVEAPTATEAATAAPAKGRGRKAHT
jgi:transcription termination factor Rho